MDAGNSIVESEPRHSRLCNKHIHCCGGSEQRLDAEEFARAGDIFDEMHGNPTFFGDIEHTRCFDFTGVENLHGLHFEPPRLPDLRFVQVPFSDFYNEKRLFSSDLESREAPVIKTEYTHCIFLLNSLAVDLEILLEPALPTVAA